MSHLIFSGDLNGKPAFLHFGGTDDGWFIDANNARIRQATPEEIEATKRFYWKDASATGASSATDLQPTVGG